MIFCGSVVFQVLLYPIFVNSLSYAVAYIFPYVSGYTGIAGIYF